MRGSTIFFLRQLLIRMKLLSEFTAKLGKVMIFVGQRSSEIRVSPDNETQFSQKTVFFRKKLDFFMNREGGRKKKLSFVGPDLEHETLTEVS